MKLETGIAWAVVFMALIAMTDIPLTAEIAAAFAWLIFVSVAMLFGPQAFKSISDLYKPTPAPVNQSLVRTA